MSNERGLMSEGLTRFFQDGRCWVDNVWDAEEQLCFKYRILRNFI